MQEIFRNILLGISLAAPLGPSSVAVIQKGLQRGFLRAFLTGLGVTMADATYLLIVFFGLSSFVSIPAVKVLIWTLGACVLLYLGIQSIAGASRKLEFDKTAVSITRNPVSAGYLVNISNPLAAVWWLGIFGSLLGASTGGAAQLNALFSSSAILIGILFWHSMMSVLTHWGKRLLNETTTRYISIIAGIVLILFGLRFAYNALSTMFT